VTHEPSRAHAAGDRPGGVPLRLVVVPSEHGGWSFLGEPILLGLLVAPSWSGALVALAATAAFLARQPLKLFVSDRQRGRRYPRTVLAERAFGVLAAVALGALAWAAQHAPGHVVNPGTKSVLWPLALAAPFGAAALAFDLGKRSRELAGELCGALALGAVASAIALAGGWSMPGALGLWGVLAAREKGQPAGIAGALLAHGAAIGWAALLAVRQVAPWLAVGAMALLAARAVGGLSPARPRLKTWQLGVTEIAFGLLTVLAVAFG
jgi:hypothetical protein